MKTLLLITAAFFMLTATVQAKSISCTVSTVKDNVVTLDCQGKSIKLEEGQQVKVKAAKKKAIEGC